MSVNVTPDGGTPETTSTGNPILKAAEKVAKVDIWNVTAANPLARLVRMAEKVGRKWELIVLKLIGSKAYNRTPGSYQNPVAPEIEAEIHTKNFTRDFETSIYDSDVAAVSTEEAAASELSAKITGELGESRDYEDYVGLRDSINKLAQMKVQTSAGQAETATNYATVAGSHHNGLDIVTDVEGLVHSIIERAKAMRLSTDKFTGHFNAAGTLSKNFVQRAENVICAVTPGMYADIMVYLKNTREIDVENLGADLIVIDSLYTNSDKPVAILFDERAVGLIHYVNDVRSQWDGDAWATKYKLHEVGNAYYTQLFNSAAIIYNKA